MGMVALEKVESPEDMESLRSYIAEHQKHTGSAVAKDLLDDFGTEVTKFVKVCGTTGRFAPQAASPARYARSQRRIEQENSANVVDREREVHDFRVQMDDL